MSRMRLVVTFALGAILSAAPAAATIDPGTATTFWDAVGYPTIEPDFDDDQQTGIADSDIVGEAAHPAFYIQFDDAGTADPTDGWIAFRVRLGADTPPAGFSHFFGVGVDADLDGDLDIFLGVDNSGAADEVAIWDGGSGLNVSPNTTTLSNSPLSSDPVDSTPVTGNYDWSQVTAALDPTASDFDLDDDGNTDYFLSFVIPFADVVAAVGGGFDDATQVAYVIGTSNQSNALNNDLGGPDDSNLDGDLTWTQLGALTNPAAPIPEPGAALLWAVAVAGLARLRRS